MTEHKPSIGVIGAEPIGRGVATLLHLAGYQVRLGTRHPETVLSHRLPSGVSVGSARQAAEAPVVIIAVRHSAAPAVLSVLKNALAGKVVIDAMNAWIRRDYVVAGLSSALTEGTWTARQLPGAHVARAFSPIDAESLVSSAVDEPGRWAVAYAADDEPAVAITERLIADSGYVPVRVGTLAESGPLDVGGTLWPYMFTPEDMRDALATDHLAATPARAA
jgi:predicted dinucleotide-binding enzyme